MKIIKIPFRDTFKASELSGIKTQTARYKRFGLPGDIFYAFGKSFQITEVFKKHLGLIAEKDYQAEGFTSPEEFKELWVKLHPRRGFRPDDRVWVHKFRKEEPNLA